MHTNIINSLTNLKSLRNASSIHLFISINIFNLNACFHNVHSLTYSHLQLFIDIKLLMKNEPIDLGKNTKDVVEPSKTTFDKTRKDLMGSIP